MTFDRLREPLPWRLPRTRETNRVTVPLRWYHGWFALAQGLESSEEEPSEDPRSEEPRRAGLGSRSLDGGPEAGVNGVSGSRLPPAGPEPGQVTTSSSPSCA